MSDDKAYPRVELVRDDLAELARGAAKELAAEQEQAERRAAFEGPPETPSETYGVLVRKLPTRPEVTWFEGEVVGILPGTREVTKVTAPTIEGVLAMCYRTYLGVMTSGGTPAPEARKRMERVTFYVATVL